MHRLNFGGLKGRQMEDCAFWASLFIVAVLKMMLVWENEMIPEGSDSIIYMTYAHDWFYGEKEMPFRGFVFPIFVALVKAMHIPFRLASELLFAGAAGAFAGSLRGAGVPRMVAVAIMAGILFHPATFQVFDMPMSESLFAILTLFLLASLVSAVTAKSERAQLLFSALIGVAAALLLNERGNDGVLILAMLGYAAGALLVVAWVTRARPRSLSRAIKSLVVMTAALLCLNVAAMTANYFAWRYFGPNEILSKGQQRLVGDLVAIDTGEPPLHKWIPVTNKALLIAYDLSPTLKEYRKAIEVDFRKAADNSSFTGFSRTGVKGQFDITDIFTLTSSVIIPQPIPRETPLTFMRRANEMDNQISREIESGFRQGRAKRRLTVYIWNPTSPILLQSVKASFHHIFKSMFKVNTVPMIDNFPFYGSLAAPLYDQMLTRRISLVSKGPLNGYLAIDKPDTIKSVSLFNDSDGYLKSHGAPGGVSGRLVVLHEHGISEYENMGQGTLTPVARDAFPAVWTDKASADRNVYRFSIPPVRDRFMIYFGKLAVTDEKGRAAACSELGVGPNIDAKSGPGGPRVSCTLTAFDPQFTKWQTKGYPFQRFIFNRFNALAQTWSEIAIGLSALMFLLRKVVLRKKWPKQEGGIFAWLALGAIASIVIERMVFFSFVDATIFPINDDRHMFDSNFLLFPLLAMACVGLSFGFEHRGGEGEGEGEHQSVPHPEANAIAARNNPNSNSMATAGTRHSHS
jgi:hypothetical protein